MENKVATDSSILAWNTGNFHGEFHRQRNLVGYSPRDLKELDMTEPRAHTHTIKGKVEMRVKSIATFFIFMKK